MTEVKENIFLFVPNIIGELIIVSYSWEVGLSQCLQ